MAPKIFSVFLKELISGARHDNHHFPCILELGNRQPNADLFQLPEEKGTPSVCLEQDSRLFGLHMQW